MPARSRRSRALETRPRDNIPFGYSHLAPAHSARLNATCPKKQTSQAKSMTRRALASAQTWSELFTMIGQSRHSLIGRPPYLYVIPLPLAPGGFERLYCLFRGVMQLPRSGLEVPCLCRVSRVYRRSTSTQKRLLRSEVLISGSHIRSAVNVQRVGKR
jgi:hypothetical protein